MLLCAILTKDDLVSVLEQLTPLSLTLRGGRAISLGRPSTMELVRGAGLRLRGDARFTWDAGGLTIPVSLRAWQVLLVPSLAARGGGHVLAFDPELEALDFKSVPVFLDARIKAAINEGLAVQRNRLFWDFEKYLSHVWSLPASVAPKGELRLGPSGAHLAVSEQDVRLTVDLGVQVSREGESTRQSPDVISQCTRVNVAPKKMIWDDR